MKISQKFMVVLATCTLLGAGVGIYFWRYPLQLFPELPSGPPRARQLETSGFVYDPDTVYTLEFLKGGHQAIAAISPEIPTVSQRVYLGDAQYNALSLSRHQAFLAVYRYQSTFGEAGGQLVDQIQLPQEHTPLSHIRPYTLQGAMPIKMCIVGDYLWVQVRHLRDVPHSGFEIYNVRTGDYVTTVDLGEDYIGMEWVLDPTKQHLYVVARSHYVNKEISPHLPNWFKEKKTDYAVLFVIDTTLFKILDIHPFLLDIISAGEIVLSGGELIIASGSKYSDIENAELRNQIPYPELIFFSLAQKKIVRRIPLSGSPALLRSHSKTGFLYIGLQPDNKVVTFDLNTQKIVQTFDVPGVRDMIIRGDYLYCNQRFLFLGNDYQDPPQISIWDLRTGKEVQRIPGTFGPFALQF